MGSHPPFAGRRSAEAPPTGHLYWVGAAGWSEISFKENRYGKWKDSEQVRDGGVFGGAGRDYQEAGAGGDRGAGGTGLQAGEEHLRGAGPGQAGAGRSSGTEDDHALWPQYGQRDADSQEEGSQVPHRQGGEGRDSWAAEVIVFGMQGLD